jgi:CHAT domain-containing protein/tetratricopeptide (TPR) repeat protein
VVAVADVAVTPGLLFLWLTFAQQTPVTVAALQSIAQRPHTDARLVIAAKEQSDTLRAAFGQSLRQANFEVARRLAHAYAVAWSDPFLVRQLARFKAANRTQRRARLQADSLRKAGNIALVQRGVPAAMRLWRRSLLQAVAADDSSGQAATLGNLGAGFYRAGKLDSAQSYLLRSQRLATAIGDVRTIANATGLLASIRQERGDLGKAAELYATASSLRERSGDFRGLAADQNNVGLIARDLGDFALATRSFQRAVALNERAGSPHAGAVNLMNLAGLSSTLGDYARADSLYRQAVQLNAKAGEHAENAYVLHEHALLQIRRGDYTAALSTLRAALRAHTIAGADLDAAAVRSDLAALLMATGNPQNAIRMLREAEDHARAAQAPAALRADIALARAVMHTDLNEFEAASEQFAVAEKLYRVDGNDFGLGEVAHGRALLLHIDKDYRGALALLLVARRAQARAQDARATALTDISIGYAQMQLSDTAAARRSIGEARRVFRNTGDVIGEAAALLALGDVAMERRTPVAGEKFYREAIQRLGVRPAADIRWRLHAALGSALREQRAIGPALQQLRAATTEIERSAQLLVAEERRVGFQADKLGVYAQLALAERARGNVEAAFSASERMRAQQTLALLSRSRVTTQRPQHAREQDLRRQIAELMTTLDDSGAERGDEREAPAAQRITASSREELYRAQSAYARLLTELRERDPAYAAVVKPAIASTRSITRRLRADEVMIDYLITDSAALAFVITHRGAHVVDLAVGRSTLSPLIDFAVRVTQRHDASAAGALWRAPLTRLYDYLIAPIESAGYLSGKRSVIIIPHGELHFLPFAALVNKRQRNFLINSYELSYAPSASVWLRLRQSERPRAKGVLALAPRTDVLPFSAAEVARIKQIYGRRASALIDEQASRHAFLAAAPKAGIVHFATLGVLNKHNPLFSFVELGGTPGKWERLEVHEVFGLDLDGQLIILSACQTALASGALADVPPGDDWTGLVQAFLTAGAGSVVASLWAVNDRATMQLMGKFHEQLKVGRSDATALAMAQRAAIRNPATAHPFYWAAFNLFSAE